MMLAVVTLVALVALAQGAPKPPPWVLFHDPLENPHVVAFDRQWEEFKAEHHKQYSPTEEPRRRELFRMNLKQIEMHNTLFNRGEKTFTLGVNSFADMDIQEFVKVMNGFLSRNKTTTAAEGQRGAQYLSPNVPIAMPTSVDWRTQGYVTPVKNQGQCGSCWSFSTTGALEGQHYRQTGKLVSLSEQNLVDCSTRWGNRGCHGGMMDNAFRYIKDNGGDDTEASYPYVGRRRFCRFDSSNVGATDTGYVDIPQGDESKLQEATASVGPISVAIDASHQSFQMYKSGVYDEPLCSSTQLDHGVLVVGYGTDDTGEDYWIVKNSWGPTWGENGYIRMSRNNNNQCGIATQASYPTV